MSVSTESCSYDTFTEWKKGSYYRGRAVGMYCSETLLSQNHFCGKDSQDHPVFPPQLHFSGSPLHPQLLLPSPTHQPHGSRTAAAPGWTFSRRRPGRTQPPCSSSPCCLTRGRCGHGRAAGHTARARTTARGDSGGPAHRYRPCGAMRSSPRGRGAGAASAARRRRNGRGEARQAHSAPLRVGGPERAGKPRLRRPRVRGEKRRDPSPVLLLGAR